MTYSLKPTLEEGRNIYLILGTRSTTFLFQATFIERNLEKNRILHATTIPLTYSITLLHLKTSSVF